MQLHRSLASIVEKALADRKFLWSRFTPTCPSVSVRFFFYSPDLASIAAAQGIRYIGAPVKRVHRIGPVKVVRDVDVQEI